MRLILSFIFFCSGVCFASPDTHEFKLDNGLKIIVKEDHRAPVAVSMLWYNVGSADERPGATGLAHALEHLMFKGTPNFPLGVYSKKISALGGQENAFTNDDYTAYFVKIDANKLATAFELEADRMHHLLLDNEEFKKEMQVIMEERRLRTDDNPQSLTFERLLATAHLTFPYQHPVIGWMSDLQRLTVLDARQWYEQFYAPNNATLVVVGDVEPQKVYDLANRYFGPIKKQATIERKRPIEPPNLGVKRITVHAPAQLPMLMMGYTVPSLNATDEKYVPYALEVLAGLLDAGESAPFSKTLVRKDHLASQIDIYYNIYARYQTQFIIYGTPAAPHTLNQLKKGILGEIQKIKDGPIEKRDLERVKKQIIAQKTFEKDSIFGQAMALGLLETVGLGWRETEEYTKNIAAVTPEQIKSVINRYLNPNHITEARLIPLQSE